MDSSDVRQITDSRVLAAMSHPLRRRLMDVFKVHGPSTVGLLAERTDQAPANVSHHLKVLAAADLVTEAPRAGPRPARAVVAAGHPGLRWSNADFDADPAARAVADAASSLNLDRHVALARAWHAADEAEQAILERRAVLHRPLATPHARGTGRAEPRDDRRPRALGRPGAARRRRRPQAGLRVRPRRTGPTVTAATRGDTDRRPPRPAGCCGTATSDCSGPARRSAASAATSPPSRCRWSRSPSSTPAPSRWRCSPPRPGCPGC